MIPIKNVPIIPGYEQLYKGPHYYCRYCGAEDSGRAYYTEIVNGRAWLVDLAGSLDCFEQVDMVNGSTEIQHYTCVECDREASCIEDLFEEEEEE